MSITSFQDVLKDVPDYQEFLTVDQLRESSISLADEHRKLVQLFPIGKSRAGDPIEVVKIGSGFKNALVFAMPHPNEPIGSMMLEYLATRLAEDDSLRENLDFTWYLIKCVDPDGTRLNENWFKGPFSITNYARHYYRPPSHKQVEWTFPLEYKSLSFRNPLPETQGLMGLIEEIKPDFIYSLHNAGFGGAYFYISHDIHKLRAPLYDLVRSQGLPLHLGEPEAPWMTKFADAIFESPDITQAYDFLEAQGADPTQALTGGTSSWDYAKRFCDPFSFLCELPYFHNDAIHDTSETKLIRRNVILEGTARTRDQFSIIKKIYNNLQNELSLSSPFKESIASFVNVIPQNLTAMENWAKSDPQTEHFATVAEQLDSYYIKRFYFVLLNLGMTIRMIESQIEASGETEALSSGLEEANQTFNVVSEELEKKLAYQVIPIQKLVNVQLGSALLLADYLTGQ